MYYLIRNYEPMKDLDKPVTKKITEEAAAIRYAQNLNALRVDVIACPDNQKPYVLKSYPIKEV